MNDILCNHVSRGCLGAENHGDRTGRLLSCLDLEIFVDDIQRIHLLSLVLVQTLDLDIVNGIVIQHDSLCFCKIIFQLSLSAVLDRCV